jgi:hypothetical protein
MREALPGRAQPESLKPKTYRICKVTHCRQPARRLSNPSESNSFDPLIEIQLAFVCPLFGQDVDNAGYRQ